MQGATAAASARSGEGAPEEVLHPRLARAGCHTSLRCHTSIAERSEVLDASPLVSGTARPKSGCSDSPVPLTSSLKTAFPVPSRDRSRSGPTASAAAGRPLGTTYEIGQPPPLRGAGVCEKPASDDIQARAAVRRLERWKLQGVARVVVPEERVSTCLRRPVPGEMGVGVWRQKERAHYSGLMVCGSVWVCPVCASKISETRRLELVEGIETWKARGGRVLLLTLTVPHYAQQPLKGVLAGFTKARGLLRNRKTWKGWASRVGLKGSVRALEVTHGGNGWHVHSHELLFLEGFAGGDLPGLEAEVLRMWQAACETAGAGTPNEHGVRLHDGTYAAQYASKWGLDQELTKGHIKRGRGGNSSPWDLLREVLATGEDEPAELFREYVKGFKGRRQLSYSEGLRCLLGLGVEQDDEELAARIEEEAVLLGSLSRSDWARVVLAEKRGEVLEVATATGWPGVVELVRRLRGG